MTCIEKLMKDHPDFDKEKIDEVVDQGCPYDYGYAGRPDYCGKGIDSRTCERCWDREVAETLQPDDPMIVFGAGPLIDCAATLSIKDSGDRTQFESGAVRDMRVGKGRCDLMPLEVVGEWLKDDIISCIAQFKIQGTTTFLYGALNYFSEKAYGAAYGNFKATTLLEVAKHFEEGAKKYGEDNWQKGIPVHCYIDSAVRHYLKWLRGDKDEPHDRAFVWNLMCCIWEVDYHDYSKKETE